ncbi:hypothetical protein PENSTE_c015G07463 [Penicillium steckii]|uniref:Uncharacterized protein n=1 Tax=Penicillium steckii TaxID=303698 RepID=A0A1V6T0X7_9EURO|nr:hypothetical protein PENSTE_c015G07463 [Penicillium steckii]
MSDRKPENTDSPVNTKHNNKDQDSNMPRDEDWNDESNPFVAFRRYADEQVSSLLQSVTGLPSNISRPQSDRWAVFNDDRGYENMRYRERNGGNGEGQHHDTRDQGFEGSSSHGQNNNTPNNTDGNSGENDSGNSQNEKPYDRFSRHYNQERNHDARNPHDLFGIESFFDRFEDRFFPFSPSFLHPSQRFFFPDMFEDSNSPTWPLTYIAFSPYSPLHLEHQAHYRAQRNQGVFSSIMSSFRPESDRDPNEPQWREAFEDLLRLENGKTMLDENALKAGKNENGTEWLQGLVKRGSLGDRWQYISGGPDGSTRSGIHFTGHSEDSRVAPEPTQESKPKEGPDTELDMYELFLRDIEEREQALLRGEVGSPLVRFLLEERRREREQHSRPSYDQDEQGTENDESWLDLVSGGNRKSVPETPIEPTGAKQIDAAQEPTPVRVISTMSRTERQRLADGSVETKIVKTKRFSDGREETDESVEVSHPRSHDEGLGESGNQSSKGWFWKD